MSPSPERLRLFALILVLSALVLVVVSYLANLSTIQLAPIYMFSPMVAGLLVCFRHDVTLSTVGLRIGRYRWLLIALLISLPLVAVTLALSLIVPGIVLDLGADPAPGLPIPDGWLGLVVILGFVLVIGGSINTVFAFGEEFGWRGYLLWELAPLGFWKASLVIGAVWGIWHAPVILAGYNYPSFPVFGVLVMTLACIAFSPLYTYLVIRAESVLAAAFLHGVFNGSAGFVLVYAVTDEALLRELLASPVGLAGIVTFTGVALVIHILGVPTLDREFASTDNSVPSE